MDDLEDITEAVFDIEEITEEILEPDDLIEDLIEDPLEVVTAVLAAVAGLLTVFLLLATIFVVLIITGPIGFLLLLALVTLITTILAISLFMYVRTDISKNIEQKISNAMDSADENRKRDEEMSEYEAIERIKSEYTNGEMTEKELEKAIDRILSEDKPKDVVKQYN